MTQRFTSCAFLFILTAACTAPASEGGLDPAPILTGVQVSPDTAALAPGDSVHLVVSAQWNDGSTTSIPVGWSATGGSIVGGVYHAGAVPGQYLVIVATAGAQFSDSAHIVIQ